MKTWSKSAFAGYLAALIDGEGSIEIIGSWSIRIRIANTFKPTLDAIQARLGFGKVYLYRRPKDHYKPLYVLEFSNARDMLAVGKVCGRFIHIKRERWLQAKAIIDRILSEANKLDKRNRAILAAIESGIQQKEIAARFGISPQSISRIKSGHLWRTERLRYSARTLAKRFPRGMDMVFRLHGAPA
jgi:hypothetical protein